MLQAVKMKKRGKYQLTDHSKENSLIDEIIAKLEVGDGSYKREEVGLAIEHRQPIIPRLIKVLDQVLANPLRFAEWGEYSGHLYAVMLLGHFGASEAHEKITELFSLPDEIIDPLFGDIITENLSMILWRTCGGSLDNVKTLALDEQADEWVRSAAAEAMAFAVIEGSLDRDDALSFFAGILSSADKNDHVLASTVAGLMGDLYPEEWMDEIHRAFDRGIIDLYDITPDHFEGCMDLGEEGCLDRLRRVFNSSSLDDIHASMSWWYGFGGSGLPNSSIKVKGAMSETKMPEKKVKIGRNDPCPCGSGKKYKRCCLNG